jgi:hypothetical protein
VVELSVFMLLVNELVDDVVLVDFVDGCIPGSVASSLRMIRECSLY